MNQDLPVAGGGQIWGSVIAVGIALVVVMLRNQKPRKLRIELLWIRPILFGLIIGATIWASHVPSDVVSLSIFALALALGAGLGWQRGRFMRIEVDPDTHAITSRASPVGMILIVGILGLRMALRGLALETRSALGVPAATVTDALILLIGAMVVTQSLEMWLRARRLLDEARAAKAARTPVGAQPPLVT